MALRQICIGVAVASLSGGAVFAESAAGSAEIVSSGPAQGLSDPVVAAGASGMIVGPISPLTNSVVPPGYKVAWDDGRLNPLRGIRR